MKNTSVAQTLIETLRAINELIPGTLTHPPLVLQRGRIAGLIRHIECQSLQTIWFDISPVERAEICRENGWDVG